MIELLKSRSQKNILSYNSKLLCSKVDPIREAQKWLEQSNEHIGNNDVLIVLGLGAAYHIKALTEAASKKKIIVIEKHGEIINAAKKYFSDSLLNIEIIELEKVDDVYRKLQIAQGLSQAYSVLMFGPAQSPDKEFYIQIQACLLGREPEYFDKILECKKAWAHIFAEKSQLSIVNDNLLTIKDLSQRLSSEPDRKKFIINALNELVL